MNSVTTLSSFLLGFITILTQTILIRELMIEAGLIEIVAALALALWMLFTGIGALLFPLLPRRLSAPLSLLLVLFLCFFGQLFAIRPLAALFAPVAGMALSIPAMIIVSVVALLPGCLIGGLLFPACVATATAPGATFRVYLFESVGMAIGASLFYLVPSLFSPVSSESYQRWYASRYLPDMLLFSRDGWSGRLDVVEQNGQQTFFWNGHTAGIRGPDRQVETFVRLALLQHPAPKRILLLGGLLSGGAAEVARAVPDAFITLIEPEPRLTEIFPFPIEGANLTLRTGDPLSLLAHLPPHDLIIMDLPEPHSLATARWYTREFFEKIRSLQGPQAVLVVGLPGGQGMLPPEIADLNASVQRALDPVFDKVFLIPAGRHLWVAGDRSLLSDEVWVLSERLFRQNLMTSWVNETLLNDILEPLHRQLTTAAIERSSATSNHLLSPSVVFSALRHAARRLEQPLPAAVTALPNRPDLFFGTTFGIVVLAFLLVAFAARREFSWPRILAIFTVSGAAFTLEMALLSLFQNFIGHIYHFIALFTVSVTGGLVAGLWSVTRLCLSLFFPFGALVLMAFFLFIGCPIPLPAGAYIIINFAVGVFLGMALGSLARSDASDRRSGIGFYLADLVGAAVCGLLFGATLIPLYEVRYSILTAGVLSLFGMFAALKRS